MEKEFEQEKMLIYHSQFGEDIQVQLEIQQYMNNGCIYVGMNSFDEGYSESYGDLTVNLDGKVPCYCGYLDVNNMPGIEQFVVDNELGEFTGFTKQSGYVEYPLYWFDRDKLRALCPDGMKMYEDSIGVKKTPEVHEKVR